MNVREWFAETVGYRFFGCCYNATTQPLFDYLATITPKQFLGKRVADLGCGDGINTLRIRNIFRPKDIVGYERNPFLIERAKRRGLTMCRTDLNVSFPKCEMGIFMLSLHHLTDKKKVLKQAGKNFRFLVICEPIQDLYHKLFDAGQPLSRAGWIELFGQTLKHYQCFEFRHTIIAFYQRSSA
ncbi:methyltransferase domain-containing protein [Candidatus Gottesmanbacteria bacterium]|nr:methyltransferase domain-containing protein [Candidatus Gottesmanbacteria bacterium]